MHTTPPPESPPRGDAHSPVLALQRVAHAAARPAGPGLLASLVRELAAALDAPLVFVAVFADTANGTLRSVAACLDAQPVPDFECSAADLQGCGAVSSARGRFVTHGLRARWSPGTLFASAGLDSACSLPLAGAGGEPIGWLVAMARDPLTGGDAARAQALLGIVGARAAAEIERARTEETLRAVALAVSATPGGTVFDELVRLLATILHVEVAFIARYERDQPTTLRMLAMYCDGQLVRDFVYPLAGSPCETVLGQHLRTYPEGLLSLFPHDQEIRTLCLESYAGHPLKALDGEPLGIVSVGSRRRLGHVARVKAALKIFAMRAAAEVERVRSGEAQRQALHEMREREAQYRSIFNASIDALVLRDAQFRIVDVNRTYEAMTGFTRAEVLGADRVLANPADVGERIRTLHARALEGETVQLVTQLLRRDGHRYELELRGVPVTHRGEPHVLYIGRDITQALQAQQQLRDSEEQYRAIFNASADALVLRDANYVAVEVNPAYTAMSGYSRGEVLAAARVLTQADPALRARHRADHDLALAGRQLRFEATGTRKDGSTWQAEVRATPMTYRGQPHVLYAVRDITARVAAEQRRAELERQLLQAQKMEAIGQLTGGLAHDFNNILTSVLGYIAMALERPAAEQDAALSRQLGQARLAAERARDHVAQLLSFSWPQRGERQLLAPARVLEHTLQLLRPNLPASIAVDFAADGAPAGPVPPVVADPVQFEQVLLNLCLNARDAIGEQGTIRGRICSDLAVPWRCASCGSRIESGRWICVEVSDDGRGMPREVLDRMFEPFFTTKEVGRGTGLGLAMVHGIVHDHGGHLQVESAPGQGTSFRVVLPAAAQEPPAPAPALAPAAPSRCGRALSGRVLLVEDEPDVGAYMQELLQSWGLEVVLEPDPVAASRRLQSHTEAFSLLLTDQTMPGMTGLSLARHSRQWRPDLPVLLYTGNAEGIDRQSLAGSGVDTLLHKPFDAAALRGALEQLLGRREATV